MRKLTACVRDRASLDAGDAERMYALFARYYTGGSAATFERDLAGKTHVIELREAAVLRGFSTLAVFERESGGVRTRGIYSGDTIIDHERWGEQALPLAFCRFAGQVWAQAPSIPLYWMLISKGHRTYRYLQLFAHDYHPHATVQTAPGLRRLADALYAERFGADYDAACGLVRFAATGRTRLRPEWQDVRDNLRASRAVAYFLERNPGFGAGDELACLCRLDPSNLRSIARRAFRAGAGLRDAA